MLPTVINMWKLWIPAQFLVFAVVPLPLQVGWQPTSQAVSSLSQPCLSMADYYACLSRSLHPSAHSPYTGEQHHVSLVCSLEDPLLSVTVSH